MCQSKMDSPENHGKIEHTTRRKIQYVLDTYTHANTNNVYKTQSYSELRVKDRK